MPILVMGWVTNYNTALQLIRFGLRATTLALISVLANCDLADAKAPSAQTRIFCASTKRTISATAAFMPEASVSPFGISAC
jgi:hypothetical protein